MKDADASLKTLRALNELGVRLALDDFGTGYSSLRYLRSFPLEMLKIPRPFVEGVEHSFEDSALARATFLLADTFGLDVVAEGIETSAQLAELERLGCRFGQGYLLGRPQPPAALEAQLALPLAPQPATVRVS